jgi:Uma2 family endonuclease
VSGRRYDGPPRNRRALEQRLRNVIPDTQLQQRARIDAARPTAGSTDLGRRSSYMFASSMQTAARRALWTPEPRGVFRRIGYKTGAWRDVGWWQKASQAPRRVAGLPTNVHNPRPGGRRHRYAVPMRTLLHDPLPAEVEALLERRRRLELDRHDEVWEGVLHVVPAPSHRHSVLGAQVKALLRAPATAAGLTVTDDFNLGDSKRNFRVPDGGLHRPGAADMWHPTAALVIEIISTGDETWEKLPFYAAHEVDEVLILDPDERSVTWLALASSGAGESGDYEPVERSALIELGPTELAQQIDWP